MGKSIDVTVTSARHEFLDLFKDVVTGHVERVVIDHRDYQERAVLISEARLEQLERTIATLKESAAARGFRLIGSATLVGDPDDVLSAVRAKQRTLSDVRRTSF